MEGGAGVKSWATTYFDNYRKAAAAGHSFFFSFSLFNVLHSSSLISRLFFSFFEQQNVSELMDFSRALPFEIVEKILRVFFFFFFSPGPEIDELRAALY
jgi:hypothetical protein